MKAKVSQHDTAAACWNRRSKLCIGYRVRPLSEDSPTMEVRVFAIQNNRTPSPLGVLHMERDEWSVFHGLVYQKWEDMDYPVPDDMDDLGD